jgi:hypothetical protein
MKRLIFLILLIPSLALGFEGAAPTSGLRFDGVTGKAVFSGTTYAMSPTRDMLLTMWMKGYNSSKLYQMFASKGGTEDGGGSPSVEWQFSWNVFDGVEFIVFTEGPATYFNYLGGLSQDLNLLQVLYLNRGPLTSPTYLYLNGVSVASKGDNNCIPSSTGDLMIADYYSDDFFLWRGNLYHLSFVFADDLSGFDATDAEWCYNNFGKLPAEYESGTSRVIVWNGNTLSGDTWYSTGTSQFGTPVQYPLNIQGNAMRITGPQGAFLSGN